MDRARLRMAAPHAKGNWHCWSQGSAPDGPGLTWLSAKEASLFRVKTGYHLDWVTWPELKFECKSSASHKHYASIALTMHEGDYKIFKKWDSERSLLPPSTVITPSPSCDITARGLQPTICTLQVAQEILRHRQGQLCSDKSWKQTRWTCRVQLPQFKYSFSP